MSTDAANAREVWLDVVVRRVSPSSADVLVVELERPCGNRLPLFAPGAHVALWCGGDLVRHYSLCGPLRSTQFYRLGIKLERDSRGGTAWIREHATPGARLRISAPRNLFPLVTGKADYLFISGGIGVTPILPMLHALRDARQRGRLVHMCRSPCDLAFAEELAELGTFHDVHLHIDSVAGGYCDLARELARTTEQTEVYCCGPAPVMNAVRAYADGRGLSERYHFEFFDAAADAQDDLLSEFVVVLSTTGCEIQVRAGESILSALRGAGMAIESECEEGVCGTCAVRVLAGTPDHRDCFLTSAERAANNVILTCVSRSRSARLTLEL